MRAVVDTSVLIGEEPPSRVEAANSVTSIAELHFGVLVAADDDERALRTARLGAIESAFDPLPVTAAVAREWAGCRPLCATGAAGRGAAPSISSSPQPQTFTACPS
ncbi:PilT protein domain-containing protein [Mycobacterium xenopi RIVM700367]|nr:PilT protein domain-containing protein [Mycobacterium xenopi RIVM700367]